jgi:hypothetical protein
MSKDDTSNSSRVRVIRLSMIEHSFYRQSYDAPRAQANRGSIVGTNLALGLAMKRVALVMLAFVMSLTYPAGTYVYAEGTTETPPAATTTTETPPPATPPPAETPPPAPEPAPTPAPAPAQPAPSTSSSTPAPTNTTGPKSPPGPDGKKYIYNSETGKWENDYYIWDPVTGQTKPKTPKNYSYNPATNMWDTEEYRYDAPSGKYVPNTVSVASNPNSTPTPTSSSNQIFDLYYNADISNVVVSQATSGDALVSFNTTGGSALTGDALVLATLLNLVSSSTGFNGGEVATFSSDIYGDVFGDLYVDPAMLATLQPSSAPDNSNVTLNVEGSGSIENNITLDAKSGNATVEKNTTAGDATTGNATAVLNLINVLNSAISSGDSFIGMLNIFGNLNGDILLPLGLLNTLLASGGSPSGTSGNTTTDVDLSDTQSINNLVNTAATSGNAVVDHNTSAGSATTGDSSTNITLLNLTGREVVGSNSLLVFVNVLGKWIGVIMDAPAGSTSAALGSGVTKNECSSCSGDTEINADTSSQINNNVNVNAASGDATVASNTSAGDATTGDANAAVNILNISNSSFSFDDWFGVLFINVFGTWNGSFGVDTEAGERPATATPAGSSKPKTANKVFRFVPNGDGTNHVEEAQLDGATYAAAVDKAVKAAHDSTAATNSPSSEQPEGEWVETGQQPQQAQKTPDLFFPILGFAVGGSLLGTERIVSKRQRRQK